MNREDKLKKLKAKQVVDKASEEAIVEAIQVIGIKDGDQGEKGETGLTGEKGLPGVPGRDGRDGKDGLPGAQGKAGVPGRDGIDGHGITWKGQWETLTKYTINDAVFNNGSAYITIKDHKSRYITEPGSGTDWNSVWAVMAEKGETGPGGAAGADGSGGSGSGAVDSVNGQTGVVVLNADDIDDTSTTNKFVTATDVTNLSHLSGTNTGDQDLSSLVVGPSSATDNAVARYNSTTGKLIQDSSGITIDDNNVFEASFSGSDANITAGAGAGASFIVDASTSTINGKAAAAITVPATGGMKALQVFSTGDGTAWASFDKSSGGSGKPGLFLGPGSSSRDVGFYRDNTNALAVSASAGTIFSGNISATAHTLGYVAKTTTYAASSTDSTIDCTSGTFTVTLPTAVGITGRIYTIKNSGTGVITIATTSSQTIDGTTTKTLPVQYNSLTLVSNGSNWVII